MQLDLWYTLKESDVQRVLRSGPGGLRGLRREAWGEKKEAST